MTKQDVIEKLNASNYANWAADLEYVLIEKAAWDIVSGKEKRSDIDEKSPTNAQHIKDFDTRNRSALATIYLNIELEFQKIIEHLDDAFPAMEKLRKHF